MDGIEGHLMKRFDLFALVLIFLITFLLHNYASVSLPLAGSIGLVNLGTIYLAFAFHVDLPPHGDGSWRSNLKFAIRELPRYEIAPRFLVLRFYIGILLILVGNVLVTICSVLPQS